MELSRIEGQRILRSLELKAYSSVVDALRAQGSLTKKKQDVLKNLATTLNVNEERYRSEIRRAGNDEILKSVAKSTNNGVNEDTWTVESIRNIPLVPMLAPETAYTALADNISDIVSKYNSVNEAQFSIPNHFELSNSKSNNNMIRFHSNRIFDPLTSNLEFRDEEILEQLKNVNKSNQYTHPDEYLSKIPTRIEISDTNTLSQKPNSSTSRQQQQQTPVLEPRVVLKHAQVPDDFYSHLNCTNDDVANENLSKPDSFQQSSANHERADVPMIRRAKLHAKRWNPKTQTLETPSPEKVAMIESAAKSRAHVRDRSISKPTKPTGKSNANDNKSSTDCPEYFIRFDGDVSSTQRGRRIVRKYWGRRPNKRTVRKLENSSEFDSEDSVKLPDNELIEVSDYVDESNVGRQCKNERTTMSELKIKNSSKIDKEPTRISDSSTTIEILYNDKTSSENNVAVACTDTCQNSSITTTTVDEFRPHTFNLIPASRRLKKVKKREASPGVSENEIPAKKTPSPPPVGLISLNEEEIPEYKPVAEVNRKNIPQESTSSCSSTFIEDADSQPSKNRRIRFLPAGSGEMVTKLSLLSKVRVRNVNRKPVPSNLIGKLEGGCMDDSLISNALDERLADTSSVSSDRVPIDAESPVELPERPQQISKGVKKSNLDSTGSLSGEVVKNSTCDADSENSSMRSFRSAELDELNEENGPSFQEEKIIVKSRDTPSSPITVESEEKLIDIESADIVIDDNEVDQHSATINNEWKVVNSTTILNNLFDEKKVFENEAVIINVDDDSDVSVMQIGEDDEKIESESRIRIVNARELLKESLGTALKPEMLDSKTPAMKFHLPRASVVNDKNRRKPKTKQNDRENRKTNADNCTSSVSLTEITDCDSPLPRMYNGHVKNSPKKSKLKRSPTKLAMKSNAANVSNDRTRAQGIKIKKVVKSVSVKSSNRNFVIDNASKKYVKLEVAKGKSSNDEPPRKYVIVKTSDHSNCVSSSDMTKSVRSKKQSNLPIVLKKVSHLYESSDVKKFVNGEQLSSLNAGCSSQTLETSMPSEKHVAKTGKLIEISSL